MPKTENLEDLIILEIEAMEDDEDTSSGDVQDVKVALRNVRKGRLTEADKKEIRDQVFDDVGEVEAEENPEFVADAAKEARALGVRF